MENKTSEVATLLREIGEAYREAMDAAYDLTLSPTSRHTSVLAGMERIGDAREALLAVISEEAALPLIRAATQGEAPRDE